LIVEFEGVEKSALRGANLGKAGKSAIVAGAVVERGKIGVLCGA